MSMISELDSSGHRVEKEPQLELDAIKRLDPPFSIALDDPRSKLTTSPGLSNWHP